MTSRRPTREPNRREAMRAARRACVLACVATAALAPTLAAQRGTPDPELSNVLGLSIGGCPGRMPSSRRRS